MKNIEWRRTDNWIGGRCRGETHDEEEDVIPNLEIDYENGEDDGLDSEYENDSGWSDTKTVNT